MFLYHVIDYGTDDDVAYVESVIPAKDWISALKEAREGEVSRGMCQYFRLRYGVDEPGSRLGWADTSHRLDWRPLADDESGDRFRERVMRAKRLERMDASGKTGAKSKP